MSEHITFQDFLLYSLVLSTSLMLIGLVFTLFALPAPQPEDPEEEIVITSAPAWYGDLKAKADEPVDIQALQREAFYKSFYDNIERDLTQDVLRYPPPTPGNKSSNS